MTLPRRSAQPPSIAFGVAVGLGCIATTALGDDGNPFLLQQVRALIRTSPAAGHEDHWLALARSCVGIDTMPGVPPLLGAAPAGDAEPFSLWRDRPGAIAHPDATGLCADPLAPAVNPVRNLLDLGERTLGMRTDLYEALVWQAASDTLPGERSTAGAARFNLRIDTLLFRNDGEGMGRLTAQFRDNELWPSASAATAVGTGSVSDLDEIASGDPTTLNRLTYAQTFLDDRAMVVLGKLSMNDYILNNMFASDETRQFLSRPFDGNSTWPVSFQDHALGAAIASLPTDWLFANACVADAGSTASPWIETNFDEGYAVAAETGLLASVAGLPSRLSFAWCGTNASSATVDDGNGPGAWGNAYGATAQVLVAPEVAVWAQWTRCERNVAASALDEVAVGTTIDDCFGRAGEGCGIALAWTNPTDTSLNEQVLLEAYYRVQVTGSLQVSLDGQVLMPSASPEVDDPTVVGALRAVWRF